MSPRASVAIILLLLIAVVILSIGYFENKRTLTLQNESIANLENEVRDLSTDLGQMKEQLWTLRWDVHRTQIDLSERFYPDSVRDADGNTPDVVVKRYLSACQQEDWEIVGECLTEGQFSIGEYIDILKRSGVSIYAYDINGYYLHDNDLASVYVSLWVQYSQSKKITMIGRNSYAVLKSQGYWKISQPHQ